MHSSMNGWEVGFKFRKYGLKFQRNFNEILLKTQKNAIQRNHFRAHFPPLVAFHNPHLVYLAQRTLIPSFRSKAKCILRISRFVHRISLIISFECISELKAILHFDCSQRWNTSCRIWKRIVYNNLTFPCRMSININFRLELTWTMSPARLCQANGGVVVVFVNVTVALGENI